MPFLMRSRNESVDVRLLAVDVDTSDALRPDNCVAILNSLESKGVDRGTQIEAHDTGRLICLRKTHNQERLQQGNRTWHRINNPKQRQHNWLTILLT